MLMMRGGFGGPAPADAHHARGFGSESWHQHQLMLMMHGGFGSESPGQHQLMLMMLGVLGLKAQASTS